jgi:Na+/H+ antiporter NhaA
MSLFINTLAFGETPLATMAKVGILSGSFASGMGGYFLLRKALKGSS